MISENDIRPGQIDPGSCCHPTIERIGIQKAPVPPYRLYLVTCTTCGTTLATSTLRMGRSVVNAADDVEIEVEEPAGRIPPRRKAG
jgi:hypothetical protein